MEEQLLGYLMGALDGAEVKALQQRLAVDDQLREQLEALRKSIAPLLPDCEFLDPPSGLAQRTCRYVSSRAEAALAAASHYGSASWGRLDVVVAAGVVVAASMLLFPAVNHSRDNALTNACQHNLRHVSLGLMQYSEANGGMLPSPPMEGKLAVAGIYGPTLIEGNYVDGSQRLICPAATETKPLPGGIPSLDELRAAEGVRLRKLQRACGGSYGMSLGFVRNHVYQPLRFLGRANFALMSDMPSLHLQDRRSANHGGRGQNVLFEDGQVRFLQGAPRTNAGDDYFHNQEGYTAAGNHVNDAVIVDSATPPLRLSDVSP